MKSYNVTFCVSKGENVVISNSFNSIANMKSWAKGYASKLVGCVGFTYVEVAEPSIKIFEYGQQVRVAGYCAVGVVTQGNKHNAENGIDLVLVMMGSQELHCSTLDVSPTGRVLSRRKCRTTQGWSVHWVELNGHAIINGERLYPRSFKIYGRDITVMVHHELARLATDEEIKDDLCEFGQ